MDDQRRKHRDDLIKTLEEEIEIAKGQWKSEMSDEQREKLSLRIHQKLDQISVLKVNANKNRQEQKGIPTPAQNLTFQNSDIEEEKVGSVNAKKQSFIRATNIKLSINNLLKIVFVMIVTVVGITYFWQSSKFKSSELLPTPTPSINSSSDSQSLTPISNPTPTSTSSSPTTNPSSGIPTTISSPKTPSSKTYIDFFNEGLNKESNGDIDRAIADYTESIRLNPNYARAYNNLAWAKYLQGNSQEGLVYVDKSLSLDSTKANSHHTRGAILLELNRSQEAIESFNIAINLNNQFALVYQDRGLAKFSLRDIQGAIRDYNESIRLKPDYSPAYNNRGNARGALGDRQGALVDYNKAIEMNANWRTNMGGLSTVYHNRGITKAELGDKQGALADFLEAARLFQQEGNTTMYNNVQIYIRGLGG